MATATLDRSTAEALDAGLTIKGKGGTYDKCVIIPNDTSSWALDVRKCRCIIAAYEGMDDFWATIAFFSAKDTIGLVKPSQHVQLERFKGHPMMRLVANAEDKGVQAGPFKWRTFMDYADKIGESNLLQKIADVADRKLKIKPARKPKAPRAETPRSQPCDAFDDLGKLVGYQAIRMVKQMDTPPTAKPALTRDELQAKIQELARHRTPDNVNLMCELIIMLQSL